MDYRDGALPAYRGYGIDSPHRASIRSNSSFPGATGSVSSFHDNLYPSPGGTASHTTDSRAVVSALKGLQEKIRKLELERADAEDNLKKLAAESRHYKDVLQKELTTRESTQGVIAKQNKQLEDDLQSAEARCNLLEKQLDYMRKMVQTAETDRDTAIQRSAMVAKQAAQHTSEDIRGQLEKLAGLERDHMKLTAQHSIAESKIRELEEKLREEAHQRKLVQDKTAELESVAETNRILMDMPRPPKAKKKKKRKVTKHKPIAAVNRARPPDHYRLNLGSIPFVVGQSTSKSHSLGANVQTVLSLMKAHNPALCNAAAKRAQKRYTTSAGSTPRSSDSENGFEELLLGLEDEFGHITFEHRELSRQIQESGDPRIQEDLRRELESLEARMEAKGEQIAMVRRQQEKAKKQRKQQKSKTGAARLKSASAVLPASGGEVEVITTVKTKAATLTPTTEGAKKSLSVYKGMKTLQNSLEKNPYHWD
ncbi:centrosomal protein of 57 kDa-like [Montipora capricornis]|uniref:centrosomal protein of 57 kDa-like n=1 Tax=Montipora capricornis TaxID=246305 RepID=UPI0035F10902